jgi:hypothetical protein
LFCLRKHGPKEDSIGEIADLVRSCQLLVKASQRMH